MKKIGTLLVLVVLISGCNKLPLKQAVQTPTATIAPLVDKGTVTLVIDTGGKVATYSAQIEETSTVLSLLKQVSTEKAWNLELKEYSFGTLVEAIEDKKNTSKLVWIYFVNGKSGEVGAQEKTISKGDVVEWKFMPPIY